MSLTFLHAHLFCFLSPVSFSILSVAGQLAMQCDTAHICESLKPGLTCRLHVCGSILNFCGFALWFCHLGDAKIGSNNVATLKNEDFGMRGLRRDGNAEDAWATSQNSKSYGKSISIETANLREYARYVLRTICQQVFFWFQMSSALTL